MQVKSGGLAFHLFWFILAEFAAIDISDTIEDIEEDTAGKQEIREQERRKANERIKIVCIY